VFGGKGALANGKRGLELGICFMERIFSMCEDWNMVPAFNFFMDKVKDPVQNKVMLTKEECMAVLPKSFMNWKCPI
jgi:hypothetical protein